MTHYERTAYGLLLKALFASQLRYTTCIWRLFAVVVESGDAVVIRQCADVLGE